QLPSLNAARDAQNATDDTRRIALSMAILTQVRVGILRYQLASQEVAFSGESLRVDKSLLDYAAAANTTSLGSRLEQIRAEGRYLLSRYEHEAAYSNAQAAWGRLYNSVGLDVFPKTIEGRDIKSLARDIEATMATWQNSDLLDAPQKIAGADAPR
ncbi:MAG TPA: TolC family protein, partial [Alphaproteobacteria bacterium]|nr:TolC family protein [Alphaproteobacteria bacterium]